MDKLDKLDKVINLVENFKERLSWNEYFMAIAFLISSRSPSKRLNVGAVIVKDNRIISSGYNGFPAGAPHVSIVRDNHEQNAIHAEQNAVSDAAKRGVNINETTIYITHYPCINCCKTIIASGIRTVYFKKDYKNDEIVEELLKVSKINIVKM
ncbi:Cytidine and deoxycytidylate deaminase zinc-binding region [seawater metagenome]|uniref:Cytidine and deoxycytidylate deaminase zinc-binding region n=1 Tax=seawater metagenome TaxID=1561972 RepID=A0A5E8CI19_9ZZZZ